MTAGLAAAEEISVDATEAVVLSKVDGIFTFTEVRRTAFLTDAYAFLPNVFGKSLVKHLVASLAKLG